MTARTSSASDALRACAGLSARELGDLLDLLRHTDVLELELTFGASRLFLARTLASPPTFDARPATELHTSAVDSPLVGIFHPTVGPGDHVDHGQALGTITALGVATTVDSPHSGTVEELLAQPSSAVEFGQPLLMLRRTPELA